MIDEMMPDEMREQAERLRLAAGGYYERDMRAGADALDRLADVLAYVGKQMGPPASEWEHDPAAILQTIDRIARGETND